MAIVYGPWEENGTNGMRVGIDISWSAVTYDSANVTATVKIYTQNIQNYSDNQTLTYTGGSISGTTDYTNNTGSTTGTKTSPDTARLRATKTYTYPYTTYGYSPGFRTFTATVSGAFNSVTPSVTINNTNGGTIPARPAKAPTAPTVSSTPNNGSISVTYGAPSYDGGSTDPNANDGVTVLYYQYSTDDINWTSNPTNPFTLYGANGTAITAYVRAVNNVEIAGPSTSTTNTPRTVPGPPSSISSSPNNGSITVSYGAMTDNGGNTPVSYIYSTNDVNFEAAPASPFNVNGTNGTAITVYVRASNAAGSSTSVSTTSTPRTVPSAPTSFSANASTLGQVTLSWAAPSSNGGNGVTSYVLRTGGTVLQNTSATSYTHTGLSPNTTYSYTVTAANAAGEGAASSVSATTIGGRVKIWDGSSWVTIFPQVWNGSAWVTAQARIWTGTEWKFGL